ncbi:MULTISPECIES: AEC family transporter [Gemmobacter]|jgi:predicted permease|uniref:Malonate transporter n=1 Tax=Gemmobacter nanjingensis TaxID=488454 RepID=A0ABQ3F9T9_9RHOB|nr:MULTISPECIES: AEC family transporter [Gemmobacter]OJY27393.1 MAG: malonate transporter [Rhodobacterales bacterium 65-51]GHC15124.1 malonate transporter [Gemmobacter nanjingensis]
MSALLDVIMPVFLVIGGGWLAARAKLFSDAAVDGLMRFAQTFAVPVLLFLSISRLDLSAAYDIGLFISFYAGAFAAFGLGILGARLLGRPGTDAVAIGFACLFSNSLLLGLPITERAYGADALAANYAIISIHSPLLYATGITVMELTRSHGQGLPAGRLARQVLRAIFSQPMVLGICAGFFVNLTGLPLPDFAWSALKMIGGAAIPTALFGLGGVLYRYRPEGDGRAIALVVGLSLLLHPAITWLLGSKVFGLSVEQLRSAVVTSSMAPGVNAYLFAHLYGVAKRVNASAVLLATAASIGTIWMWLHILP